MIWSPILQDFWEVHPRSQKYMAWEVKIKAMRPWHAERQRTAPFEHDFCVLLCQVPPVSLSHVSQSPTVPLRGRGADSATSIPLQGLVSFSFRPPDPKSRGSDCLATAAWSKWNPCNCPLPHCPAQQWHPQRRCVPSCRPRQDHSAPRTWRPSSSRPSQDELDESLPGPGWRYHHDYIHMRWLMKSRNWSKHVWSTSNTHPQFW